MASILPWGDRREVERKSMVDASLRMSIVNLLRDLRDNFGVTVIYITHDLGTTYYISEAPEHLYAQLLKNSVLSIDERRAPQGAAPDRRLAQAAAEQSGSGL